ncbi:MAG: DUF4928 family protein [Candidatus Eisenbacteria bacterium]|nr:DUF4928 family protein [Candidatus Eisenbacteria bacterium]
MNSLYNLLSSFARSHGIKGKSPLCVVLVVTRHAQIQGLPLEPELMLTKRGGQVRGLGKAAVQKILAEHEIFRTLAEEGGRTSRGSIGNMKEYVEFLNGLARSGEVDLESVENFWIDRVKNFFASKPFSLRLDFSKSIRSVVRDLLLQAERRQKEGSGTMVLGTVLQHLVGAKLDLVLETEIEHRGASVKDEGAGYDADFLIEDAAIHVTTSPAEALLRKCKKNLDGGLRPIIITIEKGVTAAEMFADQRGVADRVDVFDGEQFLAGNLYELGGFGRDGRRTTAKNLIARYNKIVSECETDPGLRIEIST